MSSFNLWVRNPKSIWIHTILFLCNITDILMLKRSLIIPASLQRKHFISDPEASNGQFFQVAIDLVSNSSIYYRGSVPWKWQPVQRRPDGRGRETYRSKDAGTGQMSVVLIEGLWSEQHRRGDLKLGNCKGKGKSWGCNLRMLLLTNTNIRATRISLGVNPTGNPSLKSSATKDFNINSFPILIILDHSSFFC